MIAKLVRLSGIVSLSSAMAMACGSGGIDPLSASSALKTDDAAPGGGGGNGARNGRGNGKDASDTAADADDAAMEDGAQSTGDDAKAKEKEKDHEGGDDVVKCKKVEPKDTLVAQLVEDSWIAGYPLTRLLVAPDGRVTGPLLPELVAGDLEIINSVPEALSAISAAIVDLNSQGALPDYGIGPMTVGDEVCTAVAAWSPLGPTTTNTLAYLVETNGVNDASWKKTLNAFSKVCPLVRVRNNKDAIDPPSDGSTNAVADNVSVFAYGVRANAFGLCAAGTPIGTSCMLSYAVGQNYQGRWCQTYSGSLRCLLK